MENPMVAVYDKQTGMYEIPHVVVHEAEAVRWWNEYVQDKGTKYAKHPEDYRLVQIGTMDLKSGEIKSLSPIKTLAAEKANGAPVQAQ